MHVSSRWRLVALPSVLLVASGVALTPVASSASSTAPTTTTEASTKTSAVKLRASTSGFPHSAVHQGGGAVNLTEDGTLQRFANRSASPRPKVVRNAQGNRVMKAATAVPSWLPTVAPTPVSGTTPGAVAGWEGLNENDNQTYAGFNTEPPDQGMCAGGGHVLELINAVVRVSSPTGTPQGTAYLNDFFKEPGYEFTTDPSCVYDAGSGRYYATQLTLSADPDTGELTGDNHLDLAVSKSSNPLGGYNIYSIDTTDAGSSGSPSHTDCPCIGDYPHLATDAHGVFLTTNEYPFFSGGGVFGNGFNGAQVYALSKAKVAAGASSVGVTHFENLRAPLASGPARVGFTLIPAQSPGTEYATENNGTMYLASSFASDESRPDDFTGHANQIGTWWINNTASLDSTPHLALHEKTLPAGSYGIPPLSNQKSGPVPLRDCIVAQCVDGLGGPYTAEQEGGLDSSDTRPMTAAYMNGHLVTALDTAMQVSGNLQAGFEYFRIRTAGSNTRVANSGYVGVSGGNAIFPALATNKAGRGYLGFTLSGANRYPSAGYTTWAQKPGDTLHVAGAGAGPQDGFCEYLAFNCAGTDPPGIRPRWGDYGAAAWDGHRFFVANEYIAHACSYSTFSSDFTCGDKRTFYGNFSTHIQQLH